MKPRTRNPHVYRARFAGLRVHAFGRDQILPGGMTVEVYQSRISPPRWSARPQHRQWAGLKPGDAARAMEEVSSYFDSCIEPWHLVGLPVAGFPDATRELPKRLQSPWGPQCAETPAPAPADAPQAESARLRAMPARGGLQ